MSLQKLTAFACALFFLASCKKNNGNDSNGNPNKLKWYIESFSSGTSTETDSFAVAYDNEDRITGLSSPILKFVYAYPTSKTFTLDLYEYGQLSIHEIAYINSSQFVDSTFQFDNTSDTTTEKYTYTGSLLTQEKTYDYSSLGSSISSQDDYTYDNNSNLARDVNSDGSGYVNTIATFTYTTTPVNVRISPTYYPLASKFLPATQKVTDGSANLIGTITYTYTFDSRGRLTRETDTISTGEVATKTYVYL